MGGEKRRDAVKNPCRLPGIRPGDREAALVQEGLLARGGQRISLIDRRIITNQSFIVDWLIRRRKVPCPHDVQIAPGGQGMLRRFLDHRPIAIDRPRNIAPVPTMVPARGLTVERLEVIIGLQRLGFLHGLKNAYRRVEFTQTVLRPAIANLLIGRRDGLPGLARLKQQHAHYGASQFARNVAPHLFLD